MKQKITLLISIIVITILCCYLTTPINKNKTQNFKLTTTTLHYDTLIL